MYLNDINYYGVKLYSSSLSVQGRSAALTVLDGPFWMYDLLHEEIIRAVESAPYLEGSDDKLVQISEDTVVKLGYDWDSTASEALAMELVRKKTRIAVPRMRRAIRHHHPEGNGLIVMDLVPNSKQLRVAWPSLSVLGKLKVVLTMRLYLCQLRRVQHSSSNNTPGPPGPTPLPCNGLQFGYDATGPFPTISALETYFRKEHNAAEDRASRGWTPPNCKPLDASAFASLIFTHNDLNMRNLLLDNHHMLWVVDWGWSGFYPPWFEYLGMRYAAQKDKNPESWQKCIRYMAEPAFEVEEWMKRIGYDFTDFRLPP
ncbi:hypothetical protein EV421DRAFT_2011387 [Armillaria borealis]|uniref:Aminoglycoside phosphotransferase domain-containing protein n=1 Tax=Armillaria borealis TaxID=47425 RepID=A0AA39J350_9AGAR|nr:hypothetical protein EV421DRAFT_2011387 [Armillaria borealis]